MSQVASLPESEESAKVSSPGAAQLPFGLTVALFVGSGATGLIDQLCFAKYLGYVVGATAYAVSAVLAAFMTGLALGAHWGGKWSARVTRPLLAYGVLEIGVALAVALTPFGFRALTPVYAALARSAPDSLVALSALRWLSAMVIVVLPTMAMGATLPLLSRGIEANRALSGTGRERHLSALYAANTFGGAAGALSAAYFILPSLGVNGALWLSALGSAAIGVAAILRGRAITAEPAPSPALADAAPAATLEGAPATPRERGLLAYLAFASGALVFACEVLFTHLLALIIGNSAYAFGLILAAFLTSLFIGASLSGRARRVLGDGAIPLGLALTALALLVSLLGWDKLPQLFAVSGETITSFEGREALRGVIAITILLLPTSLMGLTFPLLLQRVAGYSGVGGWVGRLTTINTLGAVVGSLGTGYLLLPALGSERSLLCIGLGFAASALIAAPWANPKVRNLTRAGILVAALFGAFAPRWDLTALTSGANVYFEGQKASQRVISIREDVHGGVTTVAETDGVYTLYTNGKFQGNTGWEMNAQRFFAHYPSIFVRHFEQALVIGLGTGTTLGTLATYPWQKIHVVEISPSISDAAAKYFEASNHGSLRDPRVELVHADGRNHLLVSDARYDLIGMELSSIWFAGAANLYSHEFYELVRARLKPDGVFQQWVQLHHVYKEDFATIVNTLRASFDHVALFYGGGQGILVASQAPLSASRARLSELEARPALREVLPFDRALAELTNDILALDQGLDAFLATAATEVGKTRGTLLSTDENLYLEYATPRGNVLPWETREVLVAELKAHRDESAVAALIQP